MLKNPLNTRVFSSLPLPPQRPLQSHKILLQNSINCKQLAKFLQAEGKIDSQDFKKIIKMTTNILRNEPNVINIDDPVTIVGDLHGQFYDLLHIIKLTSKNKIENQKYLFLGDYVDRGNFSIEVLILLFSLKITYPKTIVLLRGNHQCRQLTSYFNFKLQCLTKYNQQIYQMIMELFDSLPLACLVNQKFLCVHGGISHQLQNIKDIMKINRFQEIPKLGLFCDLLWADPIEHPKGKTQRMITPNTTRGCSYYFGYELCKHFMNRSKVISIIRAHQAQLQGFKLDKWEGKQKLPTVITVFSAPNYCDFYNNKGAIIQLENGTLNIQQFFYTPHPYILPNFMDLFQWSMPFVTQKVIQILIHIIKPNEQFDEQSTSFQIVNKKKIIEDFLCKQKQKTENNLKMINPNGLCPDQRLLQTGKYSRDQNIPFQKKKLIDLKNEQFPQYENI